MVNITNSLTEVNDGLEMLLIFKNRKWAFLLQIYPKDICSDTREYAHRRRSFGSIIELESGAAQCESDEGSSPSTKELKCCSLQLG